MDTEFADGNVTREVFLVNTSKGTSEIANRRGHTFTCVGVNLTNSVTVVLSPLPITLTDGWVKANDLIVTLPFVGVHLGGRKGQLMNREKASLIEACTAMRAFQPGGMKVCH